MEGSSGLRALGPQQYGWAQVQNIRRDPFEQSVGEQQKSVMSVGGGQSVDVSLDFQGNVFAR
jgi:hypothetical protein